MNSKYMNGVTQQPSSVLCVRLLFPNLLVSRWRRSSWGNINSLLGSWCSLRMTIIHDLVNKTSDTPAGTQTEIVLYSAIYITVQGVEDICFGFIYCNTYLLFLFILDLIFAFATKLATVLIKLPHAIRTNNNPQTTICYTSQGFNRPLFPSSIISIKYEWTSNRTKQVQNWVKQAVKVMADYLPLRFILHNSSL